jgi:hypothetical protein
VGGGQESPPYDPILKENQALLRWRVLWKKSATTSKQIQMA